MLEHFFTKLGVILSSLCILNGHPTDMNSYLAELMKTHHVHVVGYALIDHYEVIAADTLSINPKIQPTNASIFQAASLSKPLAAFVALSLVGKNKIQLDTPVNQQLQSWQIPKDPFGYSEQVTPRECLSMTSGLSYGAPGTKFPGYPNGVSIPTLEELLDGTQPATNPAVMAHDAPGECYAYTGASFMVMQKLVQDAAGKPFPALMEQDIFPQLGMQNSTYACPLDKAQSQQAIPGFDANQTMLKDGWDNIPAPASGGLWSTPTDLAHFIITLSKNYLGHENALISQKDAQTMLTQQNNSLFGLGVVVESNDKSFNFRKVGYNTGYANLFIMFPNTGQGIVVMTDSANGIELIKKLVAYVAKQQHWPDYSDDFDELTINTRSSD